MGETVHPDTVLTALSRIQGSHFEAFFKEFMPAVSGETFIPLGGMHDGGADGFQGESLYTSGDAKVFYQASVQADYRSKIRSTVKRLRSVGRTPKTLVYVTNRIIPSIDQAELELTTELDIFVRIRDGGWIANNINRNQHAAGSFSNHLAQILATQFGQTNRPNVSLGHGDNVAACVFLSYEVDAYATQSGFVQSVTDSLIIWALEDTDPEANPPKLMTKDAIKEKILEAFPFAKNFINSNLGHRLVELSSKKSVRGRELRAYNKDGTYCLPFETREEIRHEHNRIEALLYRVREQIKESVLNSLDESSEAIEPDEVVSVIMAALEGVFRNEGLKVGLIASGRDEAPELTSISDYIDQELLKTDLKGEAAMVARSVCIEGMRKLFYESTADQRAFLQTLSRTYSFLFSMKYEPKIVEYFQSMSSNLNLYVGSDILVRALSETFLRPEDRATENMIRIIREAGSAVILTELTLDEVWTHIISTDTEFQSHFAAVEPKIDLSIASQAPKILIRSYFYAKLAPIDGITRFKGWSTYVDQFCQYRLLRKNEGKESLRHYLCHKYGLKFEDRQSVMKQVDKRELGRIVPRLMPRKKSELIARNDAAMVLLVYARRTTRNERYSGNPYGFSTWWLTQESAIQDVIKDLVKARGGRCIIRPEFLMYYISMLPKGREIEALYRETFPSIYGVKLGQRVRPELLHQVLDRAQQFMAFDEARVSAELASLANKIKADQAQLFSTEVEEIE